MHRLGEGVRLLKHHPDTATHVHRVDLSGADVPPLEQQLALGSEAGDQVIHAVEAAYEGALAAARWPDDGGDGMLMLKVHIARLWQKLGDDAHNPRYIFAERGLGYRFVKPATPPFFAIFCMGTGTFS
jgi:hypothetical protein